MDTKRKYNKFDLIRFNNFANKSENKELKKIELLNKYDKQFPELPAKQKLENLKRNLGLTDADIDCL